MLNFESVTCQTTLRYVDVVSSSEYFRQIVLNLPRICLIKQERRNRCLVIFNKEVIGTLNFFLNMKSLKKTPYYELMFLKETEWFKKN